MQMFPISRPSPSASRSALDTETSARALRCALYVALTLAQQLHLDDLTHRLVVDLRDLDARLAADDD